MCIMHCKDSKYSYDKIIYILGWNIGGLANMFI